jgi:TolB-like protein
MKYKLFFAPLVLLVNGCTLQLNSEADKAELTAGIDGDIIPSVVKNVVQNGTKSEQFLTNPSERSIYTRISSQKNELSTINGHAHKIMRELVSNLQYVNATTPLAITSFSFLESDLNTSDIVGQQLSESLIHEVHKFGIPVIDFKATNFIRVTQDGDYILTKDYLDLEGELPIKYVLTGTVTKKLSGYLVNARIIGLESKAVVATAQDFLPIELVDSLISIKQNDGIVGL